MFETVLYGAEKLIVGAHCYVAFIHDSWLQ